jgi:hypothetical protein
VLVLLADRTFPNPEGCCNLVRLGRLCQKVPSSSGAERILRSIVDGGMEELCGSQRPNRPRF